MRKLLTLLAVLLGAAAVAAGINLNTSSRVEFTDCASAGSAAQTVPGGSYLMRVTDKDVFICFADSASTCATLGEKMPANTVILLTIGNGGQSVSCRSSDSTGDVIFTRANAG